MRVLIGYDGSDCADAAINDLRRAGLPPRGQFLVVSVADGWQHLPPEVYAPIEPADEARLPTNIKQLRRLAANALADARALSLAGAKRVRSLSPDWSVEPEARWGSPYGAIVALAAEWRADLVVVGSQGRSAAGRMVFGSVSQNVLSHSPCSVLVARHPDDVSKLADETPRIVLAVDGSPDASLAIGAVAARAWPAGTAVQVVSAVDPKASTALTSLTPALTAAAQQAVDAAAVELRNAGLAVTPLVLHGDPKRVLLDAADSWRADCIFIGAKGHGRVERFLLGSVSAAVAARAKCSVEVVRQV